MDINEAYTFLIDERNQALWHDVNKIFNIVLLSDLEEWIKGKRFT